MSKSPNFFVVGAPKAGTSALYEYLSQHPDIYVPARKELHFFSREHAAASYYRPHLIRDESRYLAHFDDADAETAVGDFSPSYLYFDNALARIKKFSSEAKIIILLRDPTERTISHYLMDVAKGYQQRPLLDFVTRDAANEAFHFEYITTSLYSERLKHVGERFDRDHVLVLLAEELRTDPDTVCKRVFQFLGVDEDACVDTTSEHNAFFAFRYGWLKKLRQSPAMFRAYEMLPRGVRRRLRALVQKNDIEKPDLSSERKRLRILFEPEVSAVSELLGQDLTKRWGYARNGHGEGSELHARN